MESTTAKRKWYNWKLIAIVIIAAAIFIKFFVLERKEENKAPMIVELDLDKVAFKSEKEVEALLGKGKLDSYYRDELAGCEKCPKMTYKQGKIEIIFISDLSDKILLKDLSEFDFDDRTILGLLNFKESEKPKSEDENVKRWKNYNKFSQIAAFSKGGKLDYILVNCKSH